MRLFLFCLFCCFSVFLTARSQRAMVGFFVEAEAGETWQSEAIAIPMEATPFLSYYAFWWGAATDFQIRFSKDDHNWEGWQRVTPDDHAEPRAGHKISQLGMTDKSHRFFQVLITGPAAQMEFYFYNPGDSPAARPDNPSDALESRSCPCPLPANLSRAQWCPSGNCPPNPSPTPTTTTHLIVHHSAGTNTSADWAAVVRSIWDFHVNGNGWADIGYNWLIDPNGVIYEGRGDGVLGAHFCAQNTATTGVCMLGDFTSVTPTPSAVSSLQSLLAWKACDVGADPLGAAFHQASGLNLPYISGHRDGCNTACPGNAFYPLLPNVRQGVADHINANCEATATEETSGLEGVQLAPNPASDHLDILIASEQYGDLEIELSDVYGRAIWRRVEAKILPQQHFWANVHELSPGNYWLSLQLAGQKSVFHVVKM
ncbi:MAG: N-acetylmuramoyl-L-alanine amidase [Saprospiraceae bacterium]|nr:N-acetylmuramoyl-L-alanine amidase [Saprospiraceae bacterium]